MGHGVHGEVGGIVSEFRGRGKDEGGTCTARMRREFPCSSAPNSSSDLRPMRCSTESTKASSPSMTALMSWRRCFELDMKKSKVVAFSSKVSVNCSRGEHSDETSESMLVAASDNIFSHWVLCLVQFPFDVFSEQYASSKLY